MLQDVPLRKISLAVEVFNFSITGFPAQEGNYSEGPVLLGRALGWRVR